jgi:tetratricopeptide (TPR) repeat protein
LRFEMRDYNGACSDYGLAASLDPVDAWQIVGDRANALIHLGEYRAAVEDLNSALVGCREHRKNPYWIYGQRAMAESDLGDHAGALADLNRAIELGPQTKGEFRPARYFASRAYEYQSLRDFPSALKDYDEAIALEPGNGWAYKQRAMVKEALHDKEGALKDYLESVMRGGGGSVAIPMLETGISICGERLHVAAF